MLVGFHVAMNKLNFLELEVQFLLQQILQKCNSVNQSVSLIALCIYQVFVLRDIV